VRWLTFTINEETEMISEAEQEWHRQNLAVQRQAREEEISRFCEWRERLERKMRTQRTAAAKKAAPPPPPATRGLGWAVLKHPSVPHATLEEHMREIWKFCWHGIDWPRGWTAKWGELDAMLLTLAGAAAEEGHCANRLFGRVLGLTVMPSRLILISEANQRDRSPQQFAETIIHELVHANLANETHGPKFQEALRSALAYYLGSADAPAPPSVASVPARPEPPRGVRFRPGGFLDPQLEYRG
jgi:hypothetical protein